MHSHGVAMRDRVKAPTRLSHDIIPLLRITLPPTHKPSSPLSSPQSPEAEARGSLQLLDSFDAKSASPPQAGVVAMPHGFMEDFAARYESDGLDQVMTPIGAGRVPRGGRVREGSRGRGLQGRPGHDTHRCGEEGTKRGRE